MTDPVLEEARRQALADRLGNVPSLLSRWWSFDAPDPKAQDPRDPPAVPDVVSEWLDAVVPFGRDSVPFVVIAGGVGVGKTFTASWLVGQMIERAAMGAVAMSDRDLVGFEVPERLFDAPIVLFDDVGAVQSKNVVTNTQLLLMDRWQRNRLTVLTTNLSLAGGDLAQVFGDRLQDRLRSAVGFALRGGSRR